VSGEGTAELMRAVAAAVRARRAEGATGADLAAPA
jgi:hypothetical protein